MIILNTKCLRLIWNNESVDAYQQNVSLLPSSCPSVCQGGCQTICHHPTLAPLLLHVCAHYSVAENMLSRALLFVSTVSSCSRVGGCQGGVSYAKQPLLIGQARWGGKGLDRIWGGGAMFHCEWTLCRNFELHFYCGWGTFFELVAKVWTKHQY